MASPQQVMHMGDLKKSVPTYQDEKLIKMEAIGLNNTHQNMRDSLEGSLHNGINKNSSDYQLVHLPDYTRNNGQNQDIYDGSATTNQHMHSHSITVGALTLKNDRPNKVGAVSIIDDQEKAFNKKLGEHPTLSARAMMTNRIGG